MSEQWFSIIHDELKEIRKEQGDQGKTLVRNTATLEEHIRRTEILENIQKASIEKINDIDAHAEKVDGYLKMLTPTKTKIAVILVTLSLLSTWGLIDSKALNDISKLLKGP